jgi:hypothetical protein
LVLVLELEEGASDDNDDDDVDELDNRNVGAPKLDKAAAPRGGEAVGVRVTMG